MNNILPFLLTWLQEYSYPILWLSVFVGALGIPLPNTLVLLAAGAFAAFGDFNFAWLAVVSITAFVAGDNGSYWIGRAWGSRVLDWLETSGKVRFIKPQTIARSRVYFNRRGGWAIFLSRFLTSALGGVINLLAGAELYSYKRFLAYDISGEALGALIPLGLGYIFGTSWEAVGEILGSFSVFILAALVVLFLSYQVVRMFKLARKQRALQQEARSAEPLAVSTVSSSLPSSEQASPSSGNLLL